MLSPAPLSYAHQAFQNLNIFLIGNLTAKHQKSSALPDKFSDTLWNNHSFLILYWAWPKGFQYVEYRSGEIHKILKLAPKGTL